VSNDFSEFQRKRSMAAKDDISEFVRGLDALDVWTCLDLDGLPDPSRTCPFHEDSRPSFSVYRASNDGRWRWKCHSGCGQGDLLDLVVKAEGLSKGEALAFLRKNCVSKALSNGFFLSSGSGKEPVQPPQPDLDLAVGTDAEFAALAALRGFTDRSLRLASERGLLRFADYKGERCWVITDATGVAISCRPLAAREWKDGDKAKAKNVRHTNSNQLLGVDRAPRHYLVFLTEGGPDLLAAHELIHAYAEANARDVAALGAVGFLSAMSTPSTTALWKMEDARIIVFAHSDPAGLEAAEGWAGQFRPASIFAHVIEAHELVPGSKDLLEVVQSPGGMLKAIGAINRILSQNQ
jgi:hypothetical protein